jgi:hypothetical protein
VLVGSAYDVLGYQSALSLEYTFIAWPIPRRFDAHTARFVISRARARLGRRMEINSAMIATTTSSSISVKPFLRFTENLLQLPMNHMFDQFVRASNPGWSDEIRKRALSPSAAVSPTAGDAPRVVRQAID